MTSGYNGPPRADKVRPEPPPTPPRLSTGPTFAWLIEYGPSTKSYPLYFAGFGRSRRSGESVICGNLCGSWRNANDLADPLRPQGGRREAASADSRSAARIASSSMDGADDHRRPRRRRPAARPADGLHADRRRYLHFRRPGLRRQNLRPPDLARWHEVPDYKGVVFRRTKPQITQAGGLGRIREGLSAVRRHQQAIGPPLEVPRRRQRRDAGLPVRGTPSASRAFRPTSWPSTNWRTSMRSRSST